jgi:transposase InsO family protein
MTALASRTARSTIHDDERKDTCAGFWERANAWFAAHGVTVTGVMTDNAKAYWSHAFSDALAAGGARRWSIPPYSPQINGKVERFNRTLLDEWAYVQVWDTDSDRASALDDWLHLYNHHRNHTAIGGPPISRVNNLAGHYS